MERRRLSATRRYLRDLELPHDWAQRAAHFYHSLKFFYRRKW